MAMNGVDAGQPPALWALASTAIFRHLKTQAAVGNPRIQPGSDVIVCAEMDEQWGYYVGLNRASAGCFTRMTGSGRRLLRTYSVNALWPHWSVF
ncbi:hypothetical protein [Escherichia coli]|uniref:hypothetical protein n=1 Tax=Escherichia coli TaxID=562 RepID=UPI00388DE0F4